MKICKDGVAVGACIHCPECYEPEEDEYECMDMGKLLYFPHDRIPVWCRLPEEADDEK